MEQKRKKAKLFDIKLFPMDAGRFVCTLMPLFFRIKKIYTNEQAKKHIRGGAIIVSNHISLTDPLMVGTLFWYRRMFFLTAKEVMEKNVFGKLLSLMGCISINRDICDMNAIRHSVEVLKKGHVLTVFPQGGIRDEANMSAIKSGVILIALQSHVPIVPIYIHKGKGLFERNVGVIGEAVDLSDITSSPIPGMADIQKAADIVLQRMVECKEKFEIYQGGKKQW